MAATTDIHLIISYINVSALSWVVWDHLLTFTSDIRFMCKLRRFDLGAIAFLLNRYMTEAGLAYLIWMLPNPLPEGASVHVCGRRMIGLLTFVVVSLVTENVAMASRMYHLWSKRKMVLYAFCIALTVSSFALSLSMAFLMRDAYEDMFQVVGRVCNLVKVSPFMAGIWVAVLVYDIFMLFMFSVNVLEQPYRHNSDIYQRFKRNGTVVYSILGAVRLTNLLVSLLLSPSVFLTVPVCLWAVANVTMSRLMLQAECVQTMIGMERSSYEMATRRQNW